MESSSLAGDALAKGAGPVENVGTPGNLATAAVPGTGSTTSTSVTLPTGEDLDLTSAPANDSTSEEEVDDDEEGAMRRQDGAGLFAMRDEIPISELMDDEDMGDEAEGLELSAATDVDMGQQNGLADLAMSGVGDSAANNSESASVRNLIMAAIGVMKNRKARPDTKRICNWIHRRYNKPYQCISDELEKMVVNGDLARVDYKGSVSFRINTPGKIVKRKKKTDKLQICKKRPALNGSNEFAASAVSKSTVGNPVIPTGYSPIESDDFLGEIPYKVCEISLRSLVNDLVGDTSMNGGSSITITTSFIRKAVEQSKRFIDRKKIIENLDEILAKELKAGNFTLIGPDTYTLPRQVSSSVPGAAQNFGNEGHGQQRPQGAKSDEERKNDLIQEKLSMFRDKELKGKGSPMRQKVQQQVVRDLPLMTPRERRIAAHSRKSLLRPMTDQDEEAKKDALALPLIEAAVRGRPRTRGRPKKIKPKEMLEKKMKEAWQTGGSRITPEPPRVSRVDSPSQYSGNEATSGGRPGSKREKKSRKIFDPADHEQPVRKRKASPSSSPTPPSPSSATTTSTELTPGPPTAATPTAAANQVNGITLLKDNDICVHCQLPAFSPLLNGRSEFLMQCKDCSTKAHPSCMEFSEELAQKIVMADWQCISCKTCAVCEEAKPEDDYEMLFCDACDLGYHMSCHKPPVLAAPSGKWICFQCNPMPPPKLSSSKNRSMRRTASSENSVRSLNNGTRIGGTEDEVSKFLPILPPHLHPHTGLVPKNWEEFPADPSIPDVTNWDPNQISSYFLGLGFPIEQAEVFIKEEIDGKSLLLLHRQDVIANLGLKLGPAVKLFTQVKKLQTRRNFS